MQESDSIYIVGRGPSLASYEFDPAITIMAVSSAVFALQVKPQHFCTLDAVKYFDDRHIADRDHSWPNSVHCRWWDFLHDGDVMKHVPLSRHKPGHERTIAVDLQERINAVHGGVGDKVMAGFEKYPHALGWQPGWADYTDVHAYPMNPATGLCFDPNEQDAMTGLHACSSSMIFAVQVAAWMGFRRLIFVGCDLTHAVYELVTPTLKQWYPAAQKHGIEWVCDTPGSPLAEFMAEGVAV